MKKIQQIILLGLSLLFVTSCDRHDKMDDLVYVGKMAPQVYWSIASTTVPAGSDVAFETRYYTTAEYPISHLEVWYNVVETETKSVSAPWMVSSAFTVASNMSVERRISQVISDYEHDESRWDEAERDYKFAATFPTSNTLNKIAWSESEFDSALVVKYFGDNFMQHFKDSLHQTLLANPDAAYKDFNKLLTTTDTSDVRYHYKQKYFTPYVTKSFDENTGTDYSHFVDHVIPVQLDSLFMTFDFADLISALNTETYSISYSKQYTLNALLKCLDTAGTAGMALQQEITLN